MSLSLTNILFTITVQAKKCNANYYIKGYDLLIKYLIKCNKHIYVRSTTGDVLLVHKKRF